MGKKIDKNADEAVADVTTSASGSQKDSPTPVSHLNPSSYIHSRIITLRVGSDRKQYFVHEDLLLACSPYFRACLQKGFIEGENFAIDFKEEKTACFDELIHWLYSGTIYKPHNDAIAMFHIKVYAFADKYLIASLKNHIVDVQRRYCRDCYFWSLPSAIAKLSQLNLLDSKFAEFYLRYFARKALKSPGHWSTKSKAKSTDAAKQRAKAMENLYNDKEASTEVLKYIIRYNQEKWSDPLDESDCDFHEHSDGEECD